LKRLGDIGTVLLFLGWVSALILHHALPELSAAFFVPAVVFVLGLLMVIVSGAGRLMTGAVQIRPYEAMKRAPVNIALMVIAVLLARLVLPSDFSAVESIGLAVVIAIVMSFYSTTYRKRI
jgi:ABC-type antimicrobial peptide transport system permease subunit